MPRKVLAVLCFASFMSPFMGSAFNLALPHIAETFSFSAVTLTWFSTAYIISTAIFQIPFARIGDMFGRKRVYLTGLLGLSLTIFVCPFATNGVLLIALRSFSGIFSAMFFASSMAILTSVTPKELRARAFALNSASVYSALSLGPVAGGFLTQYLGWESVFFLSAALVAITFFMGRAVIRGEWAEARGASFDYAGSFIFALSIVALIYGFTELPRAAGLVCLPAGLAGLVFFVIFEKRAASPILDLNLFFANRVFSMSCMAALINYSANAASSFMISLYLQYVKGFAAGAAGMVLLSQALLQVASSLAAGRLSARFAPARLATLGMVLSSLGLFGLSFVRADTPLPHLLLCLAVLGTGFGLFSSPNTNVIMSSVERKNYGQASAITGTMRITGQSFSMGIAAMSISLFMGEHALTPDLYPQFLASFGLTFKIFTVLCLAGIYASGARAGTGG
ncbi:MAG: MFS transporter [Deltaproteobacteria bacterium]|jgi:MFS family permease|nr:MFS transporter [Deltaproteobacteria bacterium]